MHVDLVVIIARASVQHRFNQNDEPKIDQAAHGLHEDPMERPMISGEQEENIASHRSITDRMTGSCRVSFRRVHGTLVCVGPLSGNCMLLPHAHSANSFVPAARRMP